MKMILFAVMVSSLFIFGFQDNQNIEPKNKANIDFQFAFGVLNNSTAIPITRDTTLKSGDELKMMVNLNKDCFVYVMYRDSKGDISLLFPDGLKQFQSDYKTGKNYYIPKGRAWMMLDKNVGKETFFIIASSERLLDLELKLGNYFSATDETIKKNLNDEVITEIRELKKRFTTFATLGERPIVIGGNIRSTDTVKVATRVDVSTIASEIQANNFYSKIITIDHQ